MAQRYTFRYTAIPLIPSSSILSRLLLTDEVKYQV